MRKISIATLTVCALFSCQKEITTSAVSSSQKINFTTLDDTVYFASLVAGDVPDNHTGKPVCFYDNFDVVNDTAYGKEAVFTFTHSAGATFTLAKLYVDGFKVKVIPVTGDTLRFRSKSSFALLPSNESLTGHHRMALRLIGDGATGEWYQVKLISATFLKKTPERGHMITMNLPQPGHRMVYK